MGEVLLFSFSFLLGILTARFLGAAGKGNFWIIFNGAGLLTVIFSMRFRQSVTYYLSKNKDMLGEIVIYGLLVGVVMAVLVAIVTTVFSDILFDTLLKGIESGWVVVTLACFSYYLWALIISLLEGLMIFNAKAIFMGSSYLVKCILLFVGLSYLQLGFSALILFMVLVETVCYSAVLAIMLSRASHFRIAFSSFRFMLKYSAEGFPGTISDFYTLRIDAFLLNYFAGAAEVGIYSVAVSLASMFLYIPAAMKSVLMPYIAGFSDKEITARLSRLLLMVMGVMVLVFIPLIWILVVPLFGKEFAFSRTLFLILIPGSIFWGLFLLLSSDIEGRGLPWRISVISMVTSLSTVGLGAILIPVWNSTGAAIVSSVAQGISMVLAVRLYKRIIGVNFEQLLFPKMEDLYGFCRVANQLAAQIGKMLFPSFSGRKPII